MLNERSGISVDLARRIEAWLGPENGGSTETWLRMQINYNLWQINKSHPLRKVKRAVREVAWFATAAKSFLLVRDSFARVGAWAGPP